MTRIELHNGRRELAATKKTLRLLLEDAHARREESPALYQTVLEYEEAFARADQLLDAALCKEP